MHKTSCIAIAVSLTVLATGCGGGNGHGRESVAQQAQMIPPPPLGTDSQRSESPAADDLRGSLTHFAQTVRSKTDGRECTVAVLPVVAMDGAATPCSEYLSDELMKAFLAASATVVDRQSLKAALAEVDLGTVYDSPPPKSRFAAADILVVGRHSMADGKLYIDLKAVRVGSTELLCLENIAVVADGRIRQLVMSRSVASEGDSPLTVREVDGRLRIRAEYTESGAGHLRLLDRVRQIIRRGLAEYTGNALGLRFSPDQLEAMFRDGKETECVFGKNSVMLEMEFGVTK